MNVKMAFLNGNHKETIYMFQPDRLVKENERHLVN